MNELNKLKSTAIKIPKWIVDFKYFENRLKVNEKIKKRKLDTKHKLFVAHPFEYWHFSRGDQLARYFSGSKKMAYYGEIKKPW